MSYNLHIKFDSRVSFAEFADFLTDRENYDITKSEIFYSNESTGVYFLINCIVKTEGLLFKRENINELHININYRKPKFFGIEAEIEISALINRFQCRINDPQTQGMGEGPYSSEGFLRGWNAGNAFAIKALSSIQTNEPVWLLPSAQLHQAWHWNYTLEDRNATIEEDQFLPTIFFGVIEGKARTLTTWGAGLPAILPKVDFALIGREQDGELIFGIVSWQQLTEVLNGAGYQGSEEGFNLNYLTPPQSIIDFVEGIEPLDSMIERLAPDCILDEELANVSPQMAK